MVKDLLKIIFSVIVICIFIYGVIKLFTHFVYGICVLVTLSIFLWLWTAFFGSLW